MLQLIIVFLLKLLSWHESLANYLQRGVHFYWCIIIVPKVVAVCGKYILAKIMCRISIAVKWKNLSRSWFCTLLIFFYCVVTLIAQSLLACLHIILISGWLRMQLYRVKGHHTVMHAWLFGTLEWCYVNTLSGVHCMKLFFFLTRKWIAILPTL